MNKKIRFISLALGLGLISDVFAADAAAPSPYAELASLVGGNWVAKFPPQKDTPPMRIEMQFAWNQNTQGVRFDSIWFTNDRPAPYASGMYAWNAEKKSLAIFYTDSNGSLTEGTVMIAGDVLVHELTITNKDGSIEHARVRLTKRGNDIFDDEIFRRQGEEWTKFVEIRYERVK
jgi:hypothetical protein